MAKYPANNVSAVIEVEVSCVVVLFFSFFLRLRHASRLAACSSVPERRDSIISSSWSALFAICLASFLTFLWHTWPLFSHGVQTGLLSHYRYTIISADNKRKNAKIITIPSPYASGTVNMRLAPALVTFSPPFGRWMSEAGDSGSTEPELSASKRIHHWLDVFLMASCCPEGRGASID